MASWNDMAALDGQMGLSPVERANWNTGVFEAVRTIECDYLDRTTVYNSLIGQDYPYIPGTGAYAVGGDFQGWGKSNDAGGGLIGYEKARVRLFYSNRIEYVGGKWITEALVPSAEYRQLDARSFRWEDNDPNVGVEVRVEEAPAMREVFLDYFLTYHKVYVLPGALLTHLGACNNATVASYTLGLAFPAETLILVSASARRDLPSVGVRAWQLSYHFQFRASGANTFWRSETKQYESIYHTEDTTRYIQHPLMNFTLLIP